MLTESEKQWIEHREAMQFLTGTYIADFEEYPLWNPGKDWQEAAEFEARVAAKLATYATMMVGSHIAAPCLECPCQKAGVCYHGTNKSCQWSFLTTARLQVEEEMDNEMD